jgi:hypothetical protein
VAWEEFLAKVVAIKATVSRIERTSLPKLGNEIAAILAFLRGSVFAGQTARSGINLMEQWESFRNNEFGEFEFAIKAADIVRNESPEQLNPGDAEGAAQLRRSAEQRFTTRLSELFEESRTLALNELGI